MKNLIKYLKLLKQSEGKLGDSKRYRVVRCDPDNWWTTKFNIVIAFIIGVILATIEWLLKYNVI